MAYVVPNLPSKAAIRRAIKAGEEIRVLPTSFMESVPADGTVVIEGPHYPEPHRFYGTGTMRGGLLVAIK